MHYASDWEETQRAVQLRDRDRCMNCRTEDTGTTLDIHHIVPRSHGGSDRMSNLILLCRQCHDAAHRQTVAPTVNFESSGDMRGDAFSLYRQFFDEVPSARYDPDQKVWQVPVADMELLLESFDELSLSPTNKAEQNTH